MKILKFIYQDCSNEDWERISKTLEYYEKDRISFD